MLLDLEKKRGDDAHRVFGREYFAREVSEEWWINFANDCYSKFSPEELEIKPKSSIEEEETIRPVFPDNQINS